MFSWKEILFLFLIFILIIDVGPQRNLLQLSKSNNDIAFSLLKTFPSENNVVFSPAGISIALAMVYGGARGRTAEEMYDSLGYGKAGLTRNNIHNIFRAFLNFLENSLDRYIIEIANGLIIQVDYRVLPQYKQLMQRYYGASIKEADFARNSRGAVKEVNSWVNQKTNGKISKLIDTFSRDTRMLLLSAIYFKGTWKKTFDAFLTKREIFYNNGVKKIYVPMMRITDVFSYASFPDKRFQALELPYKGDDICMLILLPSRYYRLNQLERRINADELREIVSKIAPVKVTVRFPKFKLVDSRQLKENFQSLGIKEAFADRADFSGISGKKDLYISQIFHKTVIEVNEQGSEVATAKQLLDNNSASGPAIRIFNANRPFLFFIRDRRTNMILFAGRVIML